jgi:hypothetical protein
METAMTEENIVDIFDTALATSYELSRLSLAIMSCSRKVLTILSGHIQGRSLAKHSGLPLQ